MKSKKCVKCGVKLPLCGFYKSPVNRDGKASYCKRCTKECKQKYRKENKEQEKLKARQRYQLNKEYIYKRSKEYKLKNKNSFGTVASNILGSAKNRAKKKDLEYNLDREWVIAHLQPLKCEATGLPLVLEIDKRYQQSPFRPSIDKIDNTKGYTKDNCQIVTIIYNRAKSDCTHNEVIMMCKNLIEKERV